MAISTSAGAEVQRPLATVVIGGLAISTFITLIIIPVFFNLLGVFPVTKRKVVNMVRAEISGLRIFRRRKKVE